LCIPACPVDCISLEPVDIHLSGWASWPQELADLARHRYQARAARLKLEVTEPTPAVHRKRAIIEAALAKAQTRQAYKA
jgi:electron transport complex protein RnfB